MSVRSVVLRSLLNLSYHCGGPRARDAWRGGQIRILMYHGVSSEERWDGVVNAHGYNVSLEVFRRQMAYLARACQVVSLSDAVTGTRLSRRTTNVVLTFDDAYDNVYLNAWPLLWQHGFPALFALPTEFVREGQPLWNDIIEHAVSRCTVPRVRIAWQESRCEFALHEGSGRLELLDWLLEEGMRMNEAGRAQLMTAMRQALDVDVSPEALFASPDYRPLTPPHLQTLAASGLVEFASHSVHHAVLTRLAPPQQREELEESKRHVEELTGQACQTFCVPGGVYNDKVLERAFAAGYARVLTSNPGVADTSRRVLNRTCIFQEPDLVTFADVAHGPVLEAVQAVRRSLWRR